MPHPGLGALTALAFVLIIGAVEQFRCGKQIASYLGLVPLEASSGNRRRVGHITKQGNSLVRFLLVEAAQVTVCSDQKWRNKYFHWRCGEDECDLSQRMGDYGRTDPAYPWRASATSNRSVRRIILQSYSYAVPQSKHIW